MNKTDKLYYYSSHLFSCTAKVLECKEKDGKFETALDRTVIFPESGGQLSDTGSINGVPISYAYEKDEVIWHVSEQRIDCSDEVNVEVEPVRRLDASQQHTGEHILSGIASKLFGAVNVGFHMSEEYSTLDFDIPLTDEQISELEAHANKAIFDNIPITYVVVNSAELESRPLRKKTAGLEERTNEFRIVYIGDVDSCTCCGTHTETTSEVGVIKCTARQSIRGGVRIWFLCGTRAYNDYVKKQRILDALAERFNTNYTAAFDAMLKQGDDLSSTKHLLRVRTSQLMDYIAKNLIQGCDIVGKTKIVVFFEDGYAMPDLVCLAEKLFLQGESRLLAVLVSNNGGNVSYLIRCSDNISPAANELAKTFNLLTGGRGGGKQCYAQGALSNKPELAQSIEQFTDYIKKAVK